MTFPYVVRQKLRKNVISLAFGRRIARNGQWLHVRVQRRRPYFAKFSTNIPTSRLHYPKNIGNTARRESRKSGQ